MLKRLAESILWESFRSLLETGYTQKSKSNIGPRPASPRALEPNGRTSASGISALILAAHQGLDTLQLLRQLGTSQLRVVGSLGAQPVARAEPQHTAEQQIGIDSDGALADDNLADAGGGHPDRLGQPIMADAQWFEELLLELFSPRGMGEGWFKGMGQW